MKRGCNGAAASYKMSVNVSKTKEPLQLFFMYRKDLDLLFGFIFIFPTEMLNPRKEAAGEWNIFQP